MEEKRASRIAPKKVKKTVNSELADRLESKAAVGKGKSGKVAQSLLADDRFGSLFDNPDFQIDEEDINFKLRNPSGVQAAKMAQDDDMDSDANSVGSDASTDDDMVSGFQRIPIDDEAEGGWGNDSNTDSDNDVYVHDSDSDDDGFRGGKVRGEAHEETKSIERQLRKKAKKSKIKKKASKKQKKNIMYEADGYGLEGADLNSSSSSKKRKEIARMSLGERMKLEKEKSGIVGETKRMNMKGDGITREVTYIPKDIQRKREQEAMKMAGDDGEKKRRKRRGIKELGFKTPFKHKM